MEDLVLDDITVHRMGGQICADAIVAEGEIEVNEALLTGEAEPVRKQPGDWLLSGSFVVSGHCRAVWNISAQTITRPRSRWMRKNTKRCVPN